MKHTLFLALILLSFSSFAEVKQVDVISGDKVKINVLNCERNEQASFKLNDKSGSVSVSCEKAICQAESKKGKYNVYRFHGQECEWNGCSEKAKLVGSFKVDTIIGNISSKAALKRAMTSFLKKSVDCGSVRTFMSGYSGYLTVE